MVDIVESLVPGGKATAGPPLGPSLGPLGINIKQVVDDINEATKEFDGMQVPVKVIVDADKNVTIEVGIPPTPALILKEIGIEKGASEDEIVGNLTIEQVLRIARAKQDDVLSYTPKQTAKEIIGTCVPMGVTVEGMPPRDAQRAIDSGELEIPDES
ncbi:MAG: 50S ribosomal protein L11 [Methanosarcinales archaeon]|nr:50S ribosomal protein L11 [Methanosarcinales archaeon]